MKKLLALLIALSLFLVGCGGGSNDKNDDNFNVAVIIAGALGDGGFNDMAAAGIQKAKDDLGVDYKIIEIPSGDKTKYEPTLIDVAEEGEYDLIMVAGFAWREVLQNVAPEFPEQKFYIYDADMDAEAGPFENVYSNTFKQNEGSFLGGALASKMTTSGALENLKDTASIGLVLMMDMAVINDFAVGFIEGAKYANEDIKVNSSYIGSVDAAKAKDIAKAQFQQGADIVFQVAASAGLGVLEAAIEEKGYMIGVDQDQSVTLKDTFEQAPEIIISSVIKRVDVVIYQIVERMINDPENIAWGQSDALGIKEGAVGIAKSDAYEKLVPEDIRNYIEEVEESVVNGDIKISTAFGMSADEIQKIRDQVKP